MGTSAIIQARFDKILNEDSMVEVGGEEVRGFTCLREWRKGTGRRIR